MTFPTVATKGTTYSTAGTAATSHVIDLPDSISSGDLLVVSFGVRGNPVITWPSGWTVPTNGELNNGSNNKRSTAYRKADGTETASITVTTDTAQQAVAFPWRITGWHGTTVPEAAIVSGTTATPDPPALTPSWGAEDTLFIAGCNAHVCTVDAYPTDYLDNRESLSTGGTGSSVGGICSRNLNSTSDDPTTFTLNTSRAWLASTIAIRPAAASGATGSLTGTIPLQTADVDATVTNSGSLAGSIPLQTSDLDATVTDSGSLSGVIPLQVSDLDGTVIGTGSLTSAIPLQTASIPGSVTDTGSLAGSIPLQTSALTGTAEANEATGPLQTSIPLQNSALSGSVRASGSLAGVIPLQNFTGAATAPVGGSLAGLVPFVVADMEGTVETEAFVAPIWRIDPRTGRAPYPIEQIELSPYRDALTLFHKPGCPGQPLMMVMENARPAWPQSCVTCGAVSHRDATGKTLREYIRGIKSGWVPA